MTNTELLVLAENLGHEVVFTEIPESGSLSFTEDIRAGCFIGLDKNITPMKERELLAHELGHCECAGFYDIGTPAIVRGQIESRAKRWACHILTPVDDVREAMRSGIIDSWELAEHFGVSDEFMYNALVYYNEICGIDFNAQ